MYRFHCKCTVKPAKQIIYFYVGMYSTSNRTTPCTLLPCQSNGLPYIYNPRVLTNVTENVHSANSLCTVKWSKEEKLYAEQSRIPMRKKLPRWLC